MVTLSEDMESVSVLSFDEVHSASPLFVSSSLLYDCIIPSLRWAAIYFIWNWEYWILCFSSTTKVENPLHDQYLRLKENVQFQHLVKQLDLVNCETTFPPELKNQVSCQRLTFTASFGRGKEMGTRGRDEREDGREVEKRGQEHLPKQEELREQ